MKRTVIRQALTWGKVAVVGWVQGKVFYKSIQGSKHILHSPKALALSMESLEQAEKAGAKVIEIKDMETSKVYSSSVEHFRHFAFPIQRGLAERQLALPLYLWAVDGIQPQIKKQTKTEGTQLQMFPV